MDDINRSNKLPVAPSFNPALQALHLTKQEALFDLRFIKITGLALLIGTAAGFIAKFLTILIAFITNIAFYGRFSLESVPPAYNNLGLAVIIIPVAGALIVGFMARFGSSAIRGHGIPEAMEQILTNKSKIPPRITFLKPVSAAIAIGTGGPFGAEGPIIATGGALGSLIGQLLHTTADERKTLLAAGAAAGMAATFGSPVSAVLLAVELLLFEFRARSIIPAAIACIAADSVRIYIEGAHPVFNLSAVAPAGWFPLLIYLVIGALTGIASVGVTKAVYLVEDWFEKIPLHWMWWPAIGAVGVGITGYFVPRTLGVGYNNINDILNLNILGTGLLVLFIFKFISWVVALGSGTSGGTLAPLFTIGGGLGATIGSVLIFLFPGITFDLRIAALVGMASLFAGSSRALFTSIIFAFEITMQPNTILPLITGCSASFIISGMLMKTTIMTEKITRRGVSVPHEYASDFLDRILVKDWTSYNVTALRGYHTLGEVRKWLSLNLPECRHNGYPVIDEKQKLIGIVNKRDLLSQEYDDSKLVKEMITKPLAVAFENMSVNDAANLMAVNKITRLPVVDPAEPNIIIGIFSRSDVLAARRNKLEEMKRMERNLNFRFVPRREK